MSSIRSFLSASAVDSAGLRALFGGVSGGVAAMVGLNVADSFPARVVLIGLLTFAFASALSIVYNSLAGSG